MVKNYKEYKQHVYEMLQEGHIAELVMSGLFKYESYFKNNTLTATYKPLTKEEYKSWKKEYNKKYGR